MAALTVLEALSGVSGSISLVSWVFVLVPQLVENHRSKSAEAISLAFLFVWFVGDITNLVGAIWAKLVPTVTALAWYFCLADAVLIAQCLYYKYLHLSKDRLVADSGQESNDPHQSLLGTHDTQPKSTAQRRRNSSFKDGSLPVLEGNESRGSSWIWNTVSLVLVCVVGALAWLIAYEAQLWTPDPQTDDKDAGKGPVGAVVLGYVSAICYLGARLPQIVKNYREKSCEGLALMFFMLSLLGNATYGLSILLHSTSKQYILTNLPWLIGSLGTMGEDILIFIQFRLYARGSSYGSPSPVE